MAAELGLSTERLAELLENARATLFRHREGRIKPGRDEKVLSGWNGMMLRAFAEASAALGRPDYLRAAERNARFLLSALVVDGRLLRTWKDGRAKLLGYLEDHAMVVDGLLALHEVTARAVLARRRAPARRRDGGPLLGPGDRGVLRHRAGSRDARRPAAEPLRLGGAVRIVGGGRRAPAPGRPDRGVGSRAPRGGHDPIGRPAHGTVPLRVRTIPRGAGLPSGIAGRGGPRLACRAVRTTASPLSWRRSSAATSRTGCSPAGWRAPAGTCRSWPASGRAAGRPPTCARGTRARRPRPSRRNSASQLDGRGGRPAPTPVR